MDEQNGSVEKLGIEQLRELVSQQSKQIQSLKDSEASLLRQQEDAFSWMQQFIGSFPFGLILIENGRRIQATNKLGSACFNYADRELIKKPIKTVFPEIDCLEANKQQTCLVGRKKSGEDFTVEAYVTSLEAFGEDLLFVTVQDSTERQKLEQLQTDLIAMINHDIRAPLTSVRMTLEMVAGGTFGELSNRGTQLVTQGMHSVEYLNSLVKTLLDDENDESGELELDYKTTAIGTLINLAINAVQPPGDDSSVSIETEFTNDVVVVDENRIIQVLINLISNAVKYSPENSKVNILAGMVGVEATFEVIDRGPGIPLPQQDRIFDRYKHLTQPRSMKRSGVGLAQCKAIIEKHNGRIWVESSEGEGSKFCFTLPIGPGN